MPYKTLRIRAAYRRHDLTLFNGKVVDPGGLDFMKHMTEKEILDYCHSPFVKWSVCEHSITHSDPSPSKDLEP